MGTRTNTVKAAPKRKDPVLKMEAENIGRLVLQNGLSIEKIKAIRELFVNSKQAKAKTIEFIEVVRNGASKLAIVDDGVGMTADELLSMMQKVGKSGSDKSVYSKDNLRGNIGWGAKVALLAHNACGIEVSSWKNGVGHRVTLVVGKNGDPEIKQVGGRNVQVLTLDDKAEAGIVKRHGTMVVVHGNSPAEDTTVSWSGYNSSTWVAQEITRFVWEMPEGLTVRAKTPSRTRSALRGIGQMLAEFASAQGTVELTEGQVPATVHWFITGEKKMPAGLAPGFSQFGYLFDGEIYEGKYSYDGARAIRSFGIPVNAGKVALIVEPHSKKVGPNTQRTHLRFDGGELPFTEWSVEFRAKMPKEIEELQDANNAKALTDWVRDEVARMFADRQLPLKPFDLGKFEAGCNAVGSLEGGSEPEVNKGATPPVDIEDVDDGEDEILDIIEKLDKPERKPREGRGARQLPDGTGEAAAEHDGVWSPEILFVSDPDAFKETAVELILAANTLRISKDFPTYAMLKKLTVDVVEQDGDAIFTAALDEMEKVYAAHIVYAINEITRSVDEAAHAEMLSDRALTVSATAVGYLVNEIKRRVGQRVSEARSRVQSTDLEATLEALSNLRGAKQALAA